MCTIPSFANNHVIINVNAHYLYELIHIIVGSLAYLLLLEYYNITFVFSRKVGF